MIQNKNILVLSAHPDDETLGAGGTLHKLGKDNHIKLITFTDGIDARGIAGMENRNKKLGTICKTLNVKEFVHADFPDNKMDVTPLLDICKFIESNTSQQPDIIFTHHPDCLNIDHSLVYRATVTVFRPQLGNEIEILSYFVPSSTDYNPLNDFRANTYFELSIDDVNTKLQALKTYDEEMRTYPHTRSYKNIKNLLLVSGSEVGVEYAEKFQLMRRIIK
mgnify:FL=1